MASTTDKLVHVSCSSTLLDKGVLNGLANGNVFAIDVVGAPTHSTTQLAHIPRDVMLLVDVSGSMSGTEPQLIATIMAVGKSLNKGDRLSVTTFENKGKVIFPLTPAPTEEQLFSAISKLKANGGTNILAGILESISHLRAVQGDTPLSPPDGASDDGKKNAPRSRWDGVESEEETCPDVVVRKEDMSSRVVVVMLLSDGETTQRGMLLPTTLHLVDKMPEYQIMFHSFGFTQNHDHEVLHSLTTAGNCGAGMYYTFQNDSDIPAAVGDCLGAVSKASVHAVTLRASVVLPDGTAQVCPFFHGSQSSTSTAPDGSLETSFDEKLGAISSDEHHTLVVICDNKMTNTEAKLQIEITYNDLHANAQVKDVVQCPFPDPSCTNQDTPIRNHIKTHVIRLIVGEALLRLVDPASLSSTNISTLEEIHASLLSELEEIQKCEGALSLTDENIMISLEQDLGEALERISRSAEGIINSGLRGRFLQFAHEHLHQRSASTKSMVRSTYATKEQLAMRVRFLAASDPTFVERGTVMAEKAALNIREEGITDEQAAKRELADQELTCYVSLSSWREEEMGIGLLVKPRTMRERYKKLMPIISIVPDYMSAAAFNAGVKTTVLGGATLDREDNETEDEHEIIKSSSRGRINAWLPLYVNATHWKSAKQYAPSALSIIATQYNDMFQPIYALKVCSKLMIANVVKFTVEDQHASERAIQMYCDIHRLFLEMTKEYPDIIKEAEDAIEQFIKNPKKRSRTHTPDLGDLILYLTITPRFTWEDLKKAYIMESCRRSARFVRGIAGHVPLQSLQTEEEIFEYWMKGTNGGRVTMFNVLFLNLIARQPGTTLEDTTKMYDSRWGRLSDEKLSALKQGYDEIMKVTQLPEVLAKLGMQLEKGAIAELLLWAFECKEEVDTKWEDFPMTGGERVSEWRERSQLYQLVKNAPGDVPSLEPFITQKKHKPIRYSGLASFLASVDLNSSPSCAQSQDCTCNNCHANLERLKRAEDWKTRAPQFVNSSAKGNEPTKGSESTKANEPKPKETKLKETASKENNLPKESEKELSELPKPSLQLFIGRLPRKETSEKLLDAIKEAVPTATHVTVVTDKFQKLKGYAFAEFAADSAMQEVLQKNSEQPLKIFDKKVVVDVVKGLGRDPDFLPSYLAPLSLRYVV